MQRKQLAAGILTLQLSQGFFCAAHAQNNDASMAAANAAASPIPAIKMQVAGNPNCPVDAQRKLSHSSSSYVRMALATNPNIAESTQDLLARDSDPMVIEALVHNNKLPNLQTLSMLVSEAQPRVRESLAANAATPKTILEKLAQGPIFTE